jgi:hypothetical protein
LKGAHRPGRGCLCARSGRVLAYVPPP